MYKRVCMERRQAAFLCVRADARDSCGFLAGGNLGRRLAGEIHKGA